MSLMKRTAGFVTAAIVLLATLTGAAPTASSQAVRAGLGITTTLAANDDESTGFVSFGFTNPFSLFGSTFTGAYLNNNGNITFDAALGTFTPFPLLNTSQKMLAPFFADIDTRVRGDLMTYGATTIDGHNAFAVNWLNADYYNAYENGSHTRRNNIQLIMIEREELGIGNFDFEFNFDQIQWEAGQASGSDPEGLGGACARMGWSDGVSLSYEHPGSGVCGAFLDGGPNALKSNRLNSSVDGRYVWNVRQGVIVNNTVPEPSTYVLLASGLIGIAAIARRRRSQ